MRKNQENNIETSQLRAVENKTNDGFFSKLKSKIYTILNNPTSTLQSIKQVYKDLNIKNLNQGIGPYENYYFNPNKNKYIDNDNCGNLDMFKNVELLEDMLSKTDNSLNFDSDIEVREKCNQMMGKLIKNPIIETDNIQESILDQKSYDNISDAIAVAHIEGKKVIILSNHQNHMDTFVLDYIFHKIYKDLYKKHAIPPKKLRFISGAYMYYNNATKSFPIGTDTTFVFGASDMKEITRFFKKEKRIDILRLIKESVISSITGNKQKEAALLYPYAGRSTSKNGCKDHIEEGIKPLISNKDCIYIPIGFNGSEEIYKNSDKSIIPDFIIKNFIPDKKEKGFSYLKQNYVRMNADKYFRGGELTLEEINTKMHDISNQALDKKNNSKKV